MHVDRKLLPGTSDYGVVSPIEVSVTIHHGKLKSITFTQCHPVAVKGSSLDRPSRFQRSIG